MQEDQYVKPFDGEQVDGKEAGNDADQERARHVTADHDPFFRQPVHTDPEEGAEQNRRERLQQADDRRLHRRARDRVYKPHQRELGHPVADLRDDLAPPHQAEITCQQPLRPVRPGAIAGQARRDRRGHRYNRLMLMQIHEFNPAWTCTATGVPAPEEPTPCPYLQSAPSTEYSRQRVNRLFEV